MNIKLTHLLTSLSVACALTCNASFTYAAAIHDAAAFTDNTLVRNDDSSAGPMPLGFTANFFGTSRTSVFVNNNGNITFDSSLSTFTPFGLLTSTIPIIAPFFADWDSRPTTFGVVQYGQDTLSGRAVFGVNYIDIGYYDRNTDKRNRAQLILTDRSDIAAGDFDIEFNYDQIQWETGDASGGSGGLGGNSARVGYTDGGINDFELPGSGVNGAFLDSNMATGLIYHSLNSTTPGQYIFQVRNGRVVEPPSGSVPEPASIGLLGIGLLGFVASRRKSAKSKC
jgi:hypothetical protein